MSRKRAQEEEDERIAQELCTAEDQEAVSHKHAHEEEDERVARQCVAEEAEGSNRRGV